tara:strand:- start:95 stop:472 length:378 start_codon:yes stop_codon:yes gene_type:complete
MHVVLTFLAKYWKETALAALLFAVCFFWYQDHNSLVKAYEATVEGYETRLQALGESHVRESERKDMALREYQERLDTLEYEYEEFKRHIVIVKSERIDELVSLRKDNPEQLITEIENTFGFEHVE